MTSVTKRHANMLEDQKGPVAKKRRQRMSASDEDESRGPSGTARHLVEPPMSKIYNSSFKNNKPAELFRKDLISAMKLPDSEQLGPEDYWVISDAWKQEWERGVQVPVNPDALHTPIVRISKKKKDSDFKLPKKFIHCNHNEFFSNDLHVLTNVVAQAEKVCRYDLDDVDMQWLTILNEKREELGLGLVDELTVETVLEELETQCFESLQEAIKNQEGLGIEYDEDVICDVCRSPDSEDGNEMVFCDSCNICVHQACYGITTIPEGSWVCRSCALSIRSSCILCPNRGGAMKSTRSGKKWAHVSCALWIPEVSIGCVEKMEPITKISQIPGSRWALVCSLCRERLGACIQCSVKTCKTAYHVTCAFKHGLEMKAIIDEENEEDGVKLRSYCQKHSKKSREAPVSSDSESDDDRRRMGERTKRELEMSSEEKATAREQRIQHMEAEFYNYVNPKDVADLLHVDPVIVDFIYNYWKLKRTVNFNKSLLTPKAEESVVLCKQQEDSLFARMKMFVHLRQDLERVRNLCYMVSRREKITRSWFRLREEIFHKQAALLSDSSHNLTEKEVEAVCHANHGDSLYDRMYSWCDDPLPSLSSIISVLEGTESPLWELNGVLKSGRKSERSRQERLPNPYAKHYINGIHNRSQRRLTALLNASKDGSDFSGETSREDNDFHSPVRNQCVKVESRRSHGVSIGQLFPASCSSEQVKMTGERGIRQKSNGQLRRVLGRAEHCLRSRKGDKLTLSNSKIAYLKEAQGRLVQRQPKNSDRVLRDFVCGGSSDNEELAMEDIEEEDLQCSTVKNQMCTDAEMVHLRTKKALSVNSQTSEFSETMTGEATSLEDIKVEDSKPDESDDSSKMASTLQCDDLSHSLLQAVEVESAQPEVLQCSSDVADGKVSPLLEKEDNANPFELQPELQSQTNIAASKSELEDLKPGSPSRELPPNESTSQLDVDDYAVEVMVDTSPTDLNADSISGANMSVSVVETVPEEDHPKEATPQPQNPVTDNTPEVPPNNQVKENKHSGTQLENLLNKDQGIVLAATDRPKSIKQLGKFPLTSSNKEFYRLPRVMQLKAKFQAQKKKLLGKPRLLNTVSTEGLLRDKGPPFVPRHCSRELSPDKEKLREESAKVCESLFSGAVPSRGSLSGYRIPKKVRTENSEEENRRGNSHISPLLDVPFQKMEQPGYAVDSYQNTRHPRHWNSNREPASCIHTINGENQGQSPRLVIKLRKDPNYPNSQHWRRDSDSADAADSFRVVQNDWNPQSRRSERHLRSDGRFHLPEQTSWHSRSGSLENNNRYPMRFRTLTQKV